MQIIIKKRGQTLIHNFLPEELDNVRKICYDLKIKYYIINYQESQI